MTPQSNSRADMLVYADWLLDQGRDAEAAAVRAGVEGAITTMWYWSFMSRCVGYDSTVGCSEENYSLGRVGSRGVQAVYVGSNIGVGHVGSIGE